ncbi:hypothetical protein PPROV_000479300 [Pycnococcus provasolii]|uniref:Protein DETOXIFICATION n=1 Tax=Pycnococcus provasolii TaxID=41880 RepID=A0A830HFD8_9CHLO|nr:hypothetical protein PPROV_000479300 [Pycnococcus provasolii]
MTAWPQEIGAQLAGALPLLLFNVSQFALNLASMAAVGQLGDLELAGASLAISFSNVSGLSLVIGVSFALETLVSHANGAKRFADCGVHLQRSFVTCFAIMVLVSTFWLLGPRIFLALGQPAKVSELAGIYLIWLMPAVWGQAISNSIQRFLQAQGDFTPLLVLSMPLFAIQLALLYVLAKPSAMGYKGAAMASNITSWVGALALAAYVIVCESRRPDETERRWGGFTKAALDLRELCGFVKIAFFSMLMIIVEWWAFEVQILLSGLLPNSEGGETTAASAICFSTVAALFTAALGLSSTSSSRVGNALGEGDASLAYFRAKVTLAITACYQLFVFPLLMRYGRNWASVFSSGSSDSEVLEHVSRILPVVGLATIGDCFQGVLSGIIRGCGRQDAGSAINVVCYYVIGIPLGATLAFSGHFGILGLWIGIAVGCNTQAISLGTLVARTDWDKEARKAVEGMCDSAAVDAPSTELGDVKVDGEEEDDDEDDNESSRLLGA